MLSHSIGAVLREEFLSARYKPIVVGLGVSYSSTNNGLENTDQGQDFLNEDLREIILHIYNQDFDEEEQVQFFRETNMSKVFNSDIYNMIMKGYDTQYKINTCDNFSEEGKTDKFCEAMKQNHLKERITNTKQIINLCWTREDELFSFAAHAPGFWDRIWNTKLRLVTIPSFIFNFITGNELSSSFSIHTVAGGYCTILQALTFQRLFY